MGALRFGRVSLITCFAFSFAAFFFVAEAGLARAANFIDLGPGDPHFAAADYLRQRGVIHGYPDGSFKSEREINRAEVLKMIFLSLKPYHFTSASASGDVTLLATSSATVDTNKSYPDVAPEDWFNPYVTLATKEGMVSGMPSGRYEPGRSVNLAEFLKILFRSDNRDIEVYAQVAPYADVPRRSWFTRYFVYGRFLGLLSAESGGYVYPDRPLTRGRVALLIYDYLLAKESKRFGYASYYGDRFHGKGTASGEIFDAEALTAAHKELPFNTRVAVRNPETGKSVIVRINDRGPFAVGKDFDLSKAAFAALAPLSRGVIAIEWRIVSDYDADHPNLLEGF